MRTFQRVNNRTTRVDAERTNELQEAIEDLQTGTLPIPLPGIEGALEEYEPLANMRAGVVLAADDGVVADGVTDNLSSLQDSIDRALDAGTPEFANAYIELPPGDIAIDGELDVPFCVHLVVKGKGQGISRIVQHADNTPIWKLVTDPGSHTVRFADFGMVYANQQTTADTNAACVFITGDATSQAFDFIFERMRFDKSFRGVYMHTSAGNAAIWGVKFADCQFWRHSGAAIKNIDGSGKPRWTIDNTYILGYGTPAEYAMELAGVEVVMHNLDIEVWNYRHLYIAGTTVPALIDGYHIEGSSWSQADNRLNYFGDGGAILRQVSFAGTVESTSTTVLAFGDGGTGAPIMLDGVTSTITNNGACYPMTLANGAVGYTRAVKGTWTANPVNPASSASVAGIRQVDGAAFLPTKAGAITDADVPYAKDGAMGLDTTNHRLYVRDGGVWKYASLT